ncbi:MAG: glycoside hydrolase family 5 protein, partial [Clostridia bacterium]|nr:glycoside hydrolase family 5 protein [Clostridia bacterium]
RGMTVIRLPFTYMNVDFAAVTDYENAGKNYDFSAIDDFVTKAAEYGLYTILDLHGTYGSQNGQDHSGEVFETADEVDFYSNEQKQTLTYNLWSALSKHYKDNPAVAGYDILNEPAEKGGWIWGDKYWGVFDKIYRAIRETGDEHIVIFESCWDGGNLPKPEEYNWQNCIYSFHHYIDDNLSASEHMENWNNKFAEIYSHNLNLPLQMGEFTAYNSTEKWENTLKLLNDSEWHWTSWTYKVWGYMPWGIVNVIGNNSQKIDAANDSYETILQKFKILRTETAQKYRFGDSNKTLESLIAKSLTGVLNTEFELSKVGLIEEGGKAYAVFSGTFGKYTREELATYVIDGEVSGRVKLSLQIIEYNEKLGTFVMKAEIGSLKIGRNYLHAGFGASPENLPSAIAKIDEEHSKVTVGGRTYSLGEEWDCRQIIVENV